MIPLLKPNLMDEELNHMIKYLTDRAQNEFSEEGPVMKTLLKGTIQNVNLNFNIRRNTITSVFLHIILSLVISAALVLVFLGSTAYSEPNAARVGFFGTVRNHDA